MTTEANEIIEKWNKKLGHNKPDVISYDLTCLIQYAFDKGIQEEREKILKLIKEQIHSLKEENPESICECLELAILMGRIKES